MELGPPTAGRPKQGQSLAAAFGSPLPLHLPMAMQGSGLQREALSQQTPPHAEGRGAEEARPWPAMLAAMDLLSKLRKANRWP